MQLVAPRVSTASKNLTKTFFSESLLAVKVNPMVISTMRPSGTLAVMTPMAKTKLRMTGYPMANPNPNRRPPMKSEKMVRRMMKRLISCWRGVSSSCSPAVAAKLAICPMNVLSPVANTIPLPVPSLLRVEKKAMFLVSRGLSSVHSGSLSSSSVYPVREELSTFISDESIILISAGIFLPNSTLITSPTTSLSASMTFSWPFLITIVCSGMKSLKESIKAWLFRVCQNEMKPVIRIITQIMTPKYRLLGSFPIP